MIGIVTAPARPMQWQNLTTAPRRVTLCNVQAKGAENMGFTVRRLSPVLGAEITGIDLSQALDDAAFEAVRTAWGETGGVLVFRDPISRPSSISPSAAAWGPCRPM